MIRRLACILALACLAACAPTSGPAPTDAPAPSAPRAAPAPAAPAPSPGPAPTTPDTTGRDHPADVFETSEAESVAGNRVSALADSARQRLKANIRTVFQPPDPGMLGKISYILRNRRPRLPMATGVVAFAGNERGLAVLFKDRSVALPGTETCPSLMLPFTDAAPPVVGYAPGGPLLAVAGNDAKDLRVFDLRRCGEVAAMPLSGRALRLAVSPDGRWAAMVDEGRSLRLGPPQGPLERVTYMRFPVLDMAFTPRGGLLLTVDEGGWVCHFRPGAKAADENEPEKYRLPDGPLGQARFRGRFLDLKDNQGVHRLWDLSTRQWAEGEPAGGTFFLANETLYLQEDEPTLVSGIVLGRPRASAALSASLGLLRLDDFDGIQRYYSATTGEPRPPGNAGDWTDLTVTGDLTVDTGDARLALGTWIAHQADASLFARKMGDDGWCLFWDSPRGMPAPLPNGGPESLLQGLKDRLVPLPPGRPGSAP